MMNRMMADMDQRMNEMMSMSGMNMWPETMPGHRHGLGHGFAHHDPFEGFGRGFGAMAIPEGDSPGNHRHRHVTMTTQRMGPDGKMVSENYYNNEIYGQTADGKKISQKEELYKNDATGEKKITQEKALDGVRHKVSKVQKSGGNIILLKKKRQN